MKILIDLTSLAYNFSGIERFALSVTEELIKDETKQYILLFKDEVYPAFSATYPHVRKVVLKGKNKLLFFQLDLPARLLFLHADYYFFPAFPAPLLFFRRHAVTTIHDLGCYDFPDTNKRYMIPYYRILYRKAALCGKKIATVSEFSKGRIVDLLGVKPSNVCVCYSGLSDTFLNFEYSSSSFAAVKEQYALPEKYIVSLSTLEPRKNFRLLIDAYTDLLLAGQTDCELVLVGRKGWMIDDLLSGLPEEVLPHIHFTGFVEEEALPYIYKGASMFVFPTLYEGFGLPPIEAMSLGTPVVCSNAASMPEVLGDHALLFESRDKEGLKAKILEMAGLSSEDREAMVSAGMEWARNYTFEASASILENEVFQ